MKGAFNNISAKCGLAQERLCEVSGQVERRLISNFRRLWSDACRLDVWLHDHNLKLK